MWQKQLESVSVYGSLVVVSTPRLSLDSTVVCQSPTLTIHLAHEIAPSCVTHQLSPYTSRTETRVRTRARDNPVHARSRSSDALTHFAYCKHPATHAQFEKIRQRHFFNLDAGRKVIPKRTVGFVGMPREQALAKAREEGQHWA